MSVENRHHPRTWIEINTHICYRGRVFETVTRDVSRAGMSLSTRALTIPVGTVIDMEFRIGGRQWQMSGLVVWRDHDAIGIMFSRYQTTLPDFNGTGQGRDVKQPEHRVA